MCRKVESGGDACQSLLQNQANIAYFVGITALAVVILSTCMNYKAGVFHDAPKWKGIVTALGGCILAVAAAVLWGCAPKKAVRSSATPARGRTLPPVRTYPSCTHEGVRVIVAQDERVGVSSANAKRIPDNTFIYDSYGLHSRDKSILLVHSNVMPESGACMIQKADMDYLDYNGYYLYLNGEDKGILFRNTQNEGNPTIDFQKEMFSQLPEIFAQADTTTWEDSIGDQGVKWGPAPSEEREGKACVYVDRTLFSADKESFVTYRERSIPVRREVAESGQYFYYHDDQLDYFDGSECKGESLLLFARHKMIDVNNEIFSCFK
ncbi:MAG: hypothetical protein H7A36_07015 [Chlamydiales bacterium]|nr:hypothetical protein [Chlamydiales bacterium]